MLKEGYDYVRSPYTIAITITIAITRLNLLKHYYRYTHHHGYHQKCHCYSDTILDAFVIGTVCLSFLLLFFLLSNVVIVARLNSMFIIIVIIGLFSTYQGV